MDRRVLSRILHAADVHGACPAFTGNGEADNPWRGATQCVLPFGSRTNGASSLYTVRASLIRPPWARATDTVTIDWRDRCDDPAHTGNANCNPLPHLFGNAGGQTTVTQNPSATTTAIHDAVHGPVPAVVGGATVHDEVTVAGGPDAVGGLPAPTGTVKVDWFTNGTCTGTPAATSPALTLAGGPSTPRASPRDR